MLKRAVALLFILVVGGGVLAGTPLRDCRPGCPMEAAAGMDTMECCDKSHERGHASAPAAPAPEVCCPHESQSAPAGSTGSEAQRLPRFDSAQQQAAALPTPAFTPQAIHGLNTFHTASSSAKPAYILHLALLI